VAIVELLNQRRLGVGKVVDAKTGEAARNQQILVANIGVELHLGSEVPGQRGSCRIVGVVAVALRSKDRGRNACVEPAGKAGDLNAVRSVVEDLSRRFAEAKTSIEASALLRPI
jgi:hypothetical protein